MAHPFERDGNGVLLYLGAGSSHSILIKSTLRSTNLEDSGLQQEDCKVDLFFSDGTSIDPLTQTGKITFASSPMIAFMNKTEEPPAIGPIPQQLQNRMIQEPQKAVKICLAKIREMKAAAPGKHREKVSTSVDKQRAAAAP